MCMCPELPGSPERGFAMKHGVMPNLLDTDLTVSLRSLLVPGSSRTCLEVYLNSAALSAISLIS